MPIQSVEVLLFRLADGAEQVVMSIPATRPGRVLLAPVWSRDGTRIFFAADRRIWTYATGKVGPEPVVDVPADFYGSFRIRHYLRPSRDGGKLFALLERRNRFARSYDVILGIDLGGGRLTPLWSGSLSWHSVFEVERPLPPDIDDDAAKALFGSREHPVFEPRASRDGRFYFFDRHEMGLFGRTWVAGYDHATRREFEVRTMWRTLFWK